ncbi:MAG TPA: tetratricopeptide repeat protein [Thermoanaerobaculia bacterium]|nr:tetratricopeptide repeat protein [Thermoanaerobaculia bacterium]
MLARFVLLAGLTLLTSACVFWTPISRTPAPDAAVVTNVPMQKWDIKSCGAGALSTVLQHYGDPTSMQDWDATLPKTRGGVMSIDLVLAARQKGFDARLVTGDASLIEAELRSGNPVILMLQVIQAPGKGYDFFHYVVIDGYDPMKKLIRVQFGDARARWTTIERITPAWKATKYATILIHRGDPNAPALRAAVQLEEDGKLALASQAYREILAKDPRSLLAWTNLGNAEMRLNRNAAAEEAFRKALEIDPDSADTLNNLAWLLFEENRYAEAEPLARKAVITKAPDAWTRLDTLARILAARGACDEAAMTFRAAIAQVPEARKEDRAAIEEAASKIATCSPAAPTGSHPSTN